MKCDDYRALLPEYWDASLLDENRAELEMHLASCAVCRAEAERLGALWQNLGTMPVAEPPRGMRARFYEKLEAYQQGFDQARAPKLSIFALLGSWWSARPALAAGFSVAMLVLGFAGGFLAGGKRENTEVSQLRNEVGNMKQMVALSLLQQQTASDRLKGVNWAYRVEQPDTEVLAALLYTINHDPNVNVRLSAVDALRAFSESPVARKGLQQAITKQDSPLVQIALIDQIAELRDRSAVPTLKALTTEPQVNAEVRQRASWALGRIQ